MLFFLFLLSNCQAAIGKTSIYQAEPKKTQVYIREGVVEGGENTALGAYVSNIRRSKNPGYERIVLDVDGNAIPSFHAALEPEYKRIVFTLGGKTKTSFKPEAVKKAFAKSALVRAIEIYPKIEEDSWSFTLQLKVSYPVEIFHLSNPNRIVIDIKDAALSAAHAPAPSAKAVLEKAETLEGLDEAPEPVLPQSAD